MRVARIIHEFKVPGRCQMIKTTHDYRAFVFNITYQAKEPGYIVESRDIPAIITSGDTLAEASSNACEALDVHMESVQKIGLCFTESKHRLIIEELGTVG